MVLTPSDRFRQSELVQIGLTRSVCLTTSGNIFKTYVLPWVDFAYMLWLGLGAWGIALLGGP